MCRQQMSAGRIAGGSPTHGNQQTDPVVAIQLASNWPLAGSACQVSSDGIKVHELGDRSVPTLLVTWTALPATDSTDGLQQLLQQFGTLQQLQILQHPNPPHNMGCALLTYTNKEAAADAVARLGQDTSQQQLPQQLQTIQVQYGQQPMVLPMQQGTSSCEDSCGIGSFQTNHTASAENFDHSQQQQQQLAKQQQQQQQQQQQEREVQTKQWLSEKQLQLQQQQEEESQGAQEPVQQHYTLFFAKVPRSASRSAILELFSAFGEVVDLNLFAESADAPVSKGCGLVMFAERAVALTVLQQLGGKYTWKGMRSPMVLKLMNPDLQHRKQQQQQQQQPQTPTAAGSSSSSSGLRLEGGFSGSQVHHEQNHNSAAAAAAAGHLTANQHASGAASWHPQQQQQHQQQQLEQVPSGCSSDAYKLFIGNIPKSYSAAALRPLLECIGPVAEVVIIRDKVTTESKGSAFVWYTTGALADQAIQQLNMRVMLPGVHPDESAHNRPLVVKRAAQQWRSYNPAAALSGSSSSSSSRGYPGSALPASLQASASASSSAAAAAAAQGQPALLRTFDQAVLAGGGQVPVAQAGQILAAPSQRQLLQPQWFGPNTSTQQQYALQQQHMTPVQQQQQLQQLMLTQQQSGMPHFSAMHQMMLQQQHQQQHLQLQLQQQQHKPMSAAVSIAGQLAMLQLQQAPQLQNHSSAQQLQFMHLSPHQPEAAAPGAAGSSALMSTYNLLPAGISPAAAAAAAAGSSPGLPSTMIQGPSVQGNSPGAVQGYHHASVQGDPGLSMQGYSYCDQAALGAVQGYSLPGVQASLQGHLQGYTGLAGAQGNYQGVVHPQASVSSYMPGLHAGSEMHLPGTHML